MIDICFIHVSICSRSAEKSRLKLKRKDLEIIILMMKQRKNFRVLSVGRNGLPPLTLSQKLITVSGFHPGFYSWGVGVGGSDRLKTRSVLEISKDLG